MNGYAHFARFYDDLTRNVDYRMRAKNYETLILRHAMHSPELILDLCCGTGSLARELSALGYDIVGVDASPDMLSVAAAKDYAGKAPLFLCQSAQELDLYGTVDACICALDSLNHLPKEQVALAFQRISLFLAPGGVFAFDVNTRHKHVQVLADNVFVYDTQQVFCVWRNHCRDRGNAVDITLDFFMPSGRGEYARSSEEFTEWLIPHEQVTQMLDQTGLMLKEVLGESLGAPSPEEERLIYIVQKPI